MEYKKKLIEVALPLEAINAESAREKSIRHGHPSTLHLWWARRPLAAARAVIWASLVDDPSSLPDEFPTEEEQNKERQRLFGILERLVKWENSNNKEVLDEAKAEIMKSTDGNPPPLLDPFAGGGSIPLEAQRLGLEAHAADLNPVAVMINKAMIEIPPKFANQPPVNPEAREKLVDEEWTGTKGLAEDVRYYGEWMRQKAFEKIGHLYPTVKDENGIERTVIAWLWARTVKCPNPACGCKAPLIRSFDLSRNKNNLCSLIPEIENNEIKYRIIYGKGHKEGTIRRQGAKCCFCNTPINFEYIRQQGKAGQIKNELIAIVGEGEGKRIYIEADQIHRDVSCIPKPVDFPNENLPHNPRNFQTPLYGMSEYGKLFTSRQLHVLTTFSDLIPELAGEIEKDAKLKEPVDTGLSLNEGGKGAKAYSQALCVYISFLINKMADLGNALNRWEPIAQCPRQLFARQAIPMVWDFAESNPFSDSSGSWNVLLRNTVYSLRSDLFNFIREKPGWVYQMDAQSDYGIRDMLISTDPPYYNNIVYADLADFFYIWLRRSLECIYPQLFQTLLVPKSEELVATPYRFDGDRDKAKSFFEEGMSRAFHQVFLGSHQDIPVTVYYAFKQSDVVEDAQGSVSTGWETMLSALISADFFLTGTWPIRTEMGSRSVAQGANALASSIVIVCRKRPPDAPTCTRRDFLNILRRELKPALKKLQESNIAPVDLAQSAIGPGMAVYSRYSSVLEADGTPMSVRSALQVINQELDRYFSDQDGELDSDSRFCIDLYTQYAFNEAQFGEADVLARAKNTSVEGLASKGILSAQKGVVRLLTREEITERVEKSPVTIWLLAQQLTRALEQEGLVGAGKIVAQFYTSEPERAKALAYRLYTIADRKGWASEAFAYNSLVTSWQEILSEAAKIAATTPKQQTFEF